MDCIGVDPCQIVHIFRTVRARKCNYLGGLAPEHPLGDSDSGTRTPAGTKWVPFITAITPQLTGSILVQADTATQLP